MSDKNIIETWSEYKKKTLSVVEPILDDMGFALEKEQPHTIGERYLMQAVTTKSGKKLILVGTRKSDAMKVVIKVTNDDGGKSELINERNNRKILHKINFAARAFFSPKEILFEERDDYLISIQQYIEQESTFLNRPLEEQFFFALNSFKAQEGAHATTYGHIRTIKRAFGIFSHKEYLENFKDFLQTTRSNGKSNLLDEAFKILEENKNTIEQYCGFLVHTDFVPHNFRIQDKKLYLLDHSSIRFGNKYEGWARFLNFMALYNPELERMLVEYVHNNRTEEEHLALKLMRLYRLGEIISYYTNTLSKSEEDLHKLNSERVLFWTHVLEAVLSNAFVSSKIVDDYKKTRDKLRSPDEKLRQKGLH